MNINVIEHTNYLSGYMDAVGRTLTTEVELSCLSVRTFESMEALETEIECGIIEGEYVEDITIDFENGIRKVFEADPRERLMFYLIDCVMWYKEYTSSCIAQRVQLKGKNIPVLHFAWVLLINGKNNVFICISKQKKFITEN